MLKDQVAIVSSAAGPIGGGGAGNRGLMSHMLKDQVATITGGAGAKRRRGKRD